MQNDDAFKLRAEPGTALAAHPKCQRDFRNEDDRSLAARKRVLHGAHVDLCFPTARDAVKQLNAKLPKFETRTNRSKHTLLRGIQRMRRRFVADIEGVFGRIERLLPRGKDAVAHQSFDKRPRNARQLEQMPERQRSTLSLQQCTKPLHLFSSIHFPSFITLPGNDALHLSFAALHDFANLNEPAPLQSL